MSSPPDVIQVSTHLLHAIRHKKNIVSSEGEKKTKSTNDISNNGNVYYDDDDAGG